LLWEELYPRTNATYREKIWPKGDDELKKVQMAQLMKQLNLRDTEGAVKLNERHHLPLFKVAKLEYTEWDSECDLKSVCDRLMKFPTEETLKLANFRLKYCLDYHGVGRVGEPKFLKYKNMAWIGDFSVIRWYWPKVKTLQNYLQTFCRDYDTFLTCPFHAFGFVWILDGLCRPDDGSAPLKDFVFYKDVKRSLRSFTEESSRTLKKHVPAKIKLNVTGKSIRQGGITVLDAHPQITPGLANNRTGHCTGDNRKHYNFGTMGGSMPGMKVLAGVESIHAPVCACRMRALVVAGFVTKEEVQIFIDNLVSNDLPIFKTTGRNRVIVEICVATVIQTYRTLVKDFGSSNRQLLCAGSAVVKRLREAIFNSKLAPRGVPAADSVLFKWADEIDRDFQETHLRNRLEHIRQSTNNEATSLLVKLVETMREENKNRETSILHQVKQVNAQVQQLHSHMPPLPTHSQSKRLLEADDPQAPAKKSCVNDSPVTAAPSIDPQQSHCHSNGPSCSISRCTNDGK